MAGRFIPVPGLEEMVAAMVAPEVHRIGKRVEAQAKVLAPPTKTWVTMADEKVRRTHVDTEGQEVPGNLRFEVPSMDWDRRHRGLGEKTYMKAPKDETSRAVANIKNCRCTMALDPDGIGRGINAGEPVIEGNLVRVTVVCEGNKVAQSEFGDVYPGGLIAPGAHFMARAAAAVAAEL
jgi:hypothetical protein